MSYSEAQEAARLDMTNGHCTVQALMRAWLNDMPDELAKSLADNAECADAMTTKGYEAACLRAGKEIIGYIHKQLADNYPTEWRDGYEPDDEDHATEDRLSLGREMAKLSRSLGPRL